MSEALDRYLRKAQSALLTVTWLREHRSPTQDEKDTLEEVIRTLDDPGPITAEMPPRRQVTIPVIVGQPSTAVVTRDEQGWWLGYGPTSGDIMGSTWERHYRVRLGAKTLTPQAAKHKATAVLAGFPRSTTWKPYGSGWKADLS